MCSEVQGVKVNDSVGSAISILPEILLWLMFSFGEELNWSCFFLSGVQLETNTAILIKSLFLNIEMVQEHKHNKTIL